jgi:short-subunit dehydrogenase
MGVVHGLHSFVPRMLDQDTPAHIVNISSLAGLLAAPLMGPYTVSKQAVVALTETLHYELDSIDAKLKTSVVCPGPVSTAIANSGTGRPATSKISEEANEQLMTFLKAGTGEGMSSAYWAKIIFGGIRREQLWIFTHDDFKGAYKTRADSVIDSTTPVYQTLVTKS